MEYKDIRSQIKSGDILAFSHVGWKTFHDWKVQAIRFFTQSEYSHIATVWVTGGRVFVIEAVEPCVRVFPLSKLGDFYWMPMEAPWTPETEEYALSVIGEEYSQLQAIQSFFETPKIDKMWQCTEFSKAIAAKDGIVVDCPKPTPSLFVRAMMEQQGKQLKYVKNPL